MGSRRRTSHVHTAAALPSNRLPLGTRTSINQLTHASSYRFRPHSPISAASSSSDHSAHVPLKAAPNNKRSARMAAQDPADHKSIAAAKLERQRKRIEEADAALRPTSPSRDKRQGAANANRKQAKHSDQRSSDGGAPVSEVRISTIRVVSCESSLVRPMSVLSHHTNETAPSDTDSRDGFQVIRGRRTQPRKDELGARGDKPEPRQSTVEAAFDKRDIYEAFGNALPAPEFIEENPGAKNGQLQFVQHPNGDVSAHQWSTDRYMWENIGQFSNIRKKVEGQLASDRLKGETAHQTLQQNTLTYFRTIAKQREAHIMGVPFGVKEIQAAMPPPSQTDNPSASTSIKEAAKYPTPSTLPPTQPTTSYEAMPKPYNALQDPQNRPSIYSFPSQPPSQLRIGETFGFMPSYSQQMPRYQEDPFYSASSYQRIYGSYQQYPQPQYYNPLLAKPPISANTFGAMSQNSPNYDVNFPPPSATSRTAPTQPNRTQNGYQASQPSSTVQTSTQDSVYGYSSVQTPQYQPLNTFHSAYPPISYHTTVMNTPAPARPDTPLGSRASMSDQLWKISETAKERSLSQGNIGRTVLYDPYLNQPSTSTAPPQNHTDTPGLPKTNTVSTPQHVASVKQPASHYTPIPLNSKTKQAAKSAIRSLVEDSLHDSSPDRDWTKKPYDHTTPLLTSEYPEGTPQKFEGPFFPADKKKNPSISSFASKKSYDEDLNDWWTSGNKFALQEALYQTITAAHKATSNKTSSPSAHLTPIDPPSCNTPAKRPPQPFNPITTRLLIPVWENLSSYVQGPLNKRRDYFSQWSPAPEWAIDRSETGNDSFYDADWGQPPARVGRDPRYTGRLSWSAERTPPAVGVGRFVGSPLAGRGMGSAVRIVSGGGSLGMGLDRRFNLGARF